MNPSGRRRSWSDSAFLISSDSSFFPGTYTFSPAELYMDEANDQTGSHDMDALKANPASSSPFWSGKKNFDPNDERRNGKTPYIQKSSFLKSEEIRTAFENQNGGVFDNQTIFSTAEEAMAWRQSLCKLELPDDPTIPTDPASFNVYVKVLFQAFKSLANAQDNPGGLRPFQDTRHDNGRVEVICWAILQAIITRSLHGPLTVAFNHEKDKDTHPIGSFAERFDLVVRSMATQKSICKHLFDAPYVNILVDNPTRAIDRVEANRRLNRSKGDAMRAGKMALEKQQGRTPRRSVKRSRTDAVPAHHYPRNGDADYDDDDDDDDYEEDLDAYPPEQTSSAPGSMGPPTNSGQRLPAEAGTTFKSSMPRSPTTPFSLHNIPSFPNMTNFRRLPRPAANSAHSTSYIENARAAPSFPVNAHEYGLMTSQPTYHFGPPNTHHSTLNQSRGRGLGINNIFAGQFGPPAVLHSNTSSSSTSSGIQVRHDPHSFSFSINIGTQFPSQRAGAPNNYNLQGSMLNSNFSPMENPFHFNTTQPAIPHSASTSQYSGQHMSSTGDTGTSNQSSNSTPDGDFDESTADGEYKPF